MNSSDIANLDRLPGGPDGKIQFEQPEVSYSESSGLISVWVVRSGPAGFPASVQWSVVGGTASLPDDVDLVSPGGTLIFAPGETRKDIQLPIVQDQQPEGDETVILNLHNPVGAGLGGPFLAVVTILDDDDPSPGFSSDLSLLKWADSDIAPVGQPVRFTVQLQNSGPDPVSGLVVEDPLPAGAQLAGWNISPGTTFEPTEGRWSVPTLAPGAMAYLELALVRSSPGTLDNIARIVSPAVNDPTPWDHEAWATARWEPLGSNAVLQFETAALSVSEGAGLVAVRVLRLGDTNGLCTVRYTVSGGTATPDVDFLPPQPGDLVFAPGAAWSDLFLEVLDDALVEGNETVELTLHDPAGASLGTPTNCVVTLLDDDLPQPSEADLSLFKWAETNLAPAGQPIRFVVALQSAGPAASSNVVVQEQLPPGTVLAGWTAAPGTAFNPANGQWTLPFVGPGSTNLLLLDLVRTNAGAVTNVAFVLQTSHPDPPWPTEPTRPRQVGLPGTSPTWPSGCSCKPI